MGRKHKHKVPSEPTGSMANYERIRKAAIAVGIAFSNWELRLNRINGGKRSFRSRVFQLRNSLIYRFDAVCFCAGLLEQAYVDTSEAAQRIQDQQHGRELLHISAFRQRFLFDNLVFNCVSFFDYLGNYIGLTLQKPRNLKLRWDGTYKWAKHKEAGKRGGVKNCIYNSRVGKLIVKEDETWVRRLTEYRSEVIHYNTEQMNGRLTMNLIPNENKDFTATHEITIFVPRSFTRKLKLVPPDDKQKLSIVKAGSLLFEKTAHTGETILKVLEQDILINVKGIMS